MCVEVSKDYNKENGWPETIYFVPSDGKIRTFLEHGRKLEEFNFERISWPDAIRHVVVYDLSNIEIPDERRKLIGESDLGKLLQK